MGTSVTEQTLSPVDRVTEVKAQRMLGRPELPRSRPLPGPARGANDSGRLSRATRHSAWMLTGSRVYSASSRAPARRARPAPRRARPVPSGFRGFRGCPFPHVGEVWPSAMTRVASVGDGSFHRLIMRGKGDKPLSQVRIRHACG
jgi:hypothetical protein